MEAPGAAGDAAALAGPDPELAATMGFSGFGKKARTFDLEAMFEQTRRTAVERSRKILEAREREQEDQAEKEFRRLQPNSPASASSAIGAESTLTPRDAACSESEDSSDEELTGPSVQSQTSAQNQNEDSDDDDDEFIGPPLPPGFKDSDDDHDDDDLQEEDNNPIKKIPDSHEITLQHGTKTVSALALDPSGARLVTGGYDYDVKFWDFAGMDASLQAFRSLQPCECHQIKSLQYSSTGDVILVVSGNSQAKVLDRDGFPVMECIKGDQYIVDMTNTKGHTAMLNSGCWHPKIKEEFLTCSNDGTVRTWDVNNEKKHKGVFKPRSAQGKRVIPTTCTYSRDGKLIAAGCQDGSIQIWDRNMSVHTKFHCRQAHAPGTDTSCLTFSYDGTALASRGGDDTLKIWDIRQFKKPLNSAERLSSFFPMTDCCFSPDDKILVTGTSVKKGGGSGKLCFFDRETFQKLYEIDVTNAKGDRTVRHCLQISSSSEHSREERTKSEDQLLLISAVSKRKSVVRCLWHPKLNQIMVGTANGLAKVYYDPIKSQRGAKLCVVKTKRKERQAETLTQDYIITPHALPMFREPRQRSTRKQLEKDRLDPLKSHKPEPPVAGPGRGGRVGTHGGTLSSYIVKNIALDKTDDSNPREAILRHAKEAEENPYWVAPAYAKTQPKTVFAEVEQEDDETDKPEWKKRKI
ncbi:WD repeat-containing protein 70 isoform X1 [Rhea pennata]|uniref:WD repeat-containing protein 70 isoform X1 n=1 Tax=Rhea pennata TaxID=8795 RepID=UPI002E271B0D